MDTNVLFSVFTARVGVSAEAYRYVTAELVTLVTSPALLAERERVLLFKADAPAAWVRRVVDEVAAAAVVVEPDQIIADIEDDPDDNRVLEAALAGGADFIVSGDRHLLSLREWRGVPVRSPRDFLDDFLRQTG